ncbi:MAG: hypothetical protein ACKOAH_16980, partial [Pirellula sp.]
SLRSTLLAAQGNLSLPGSFLELLPPWLGGAGKFCLVVLVRALRLAMVARVLWFLEKQTTTTLR